MLGLDLVSPPAGLMLLWLGCTGVLKPSCLVFYKSDKTQAFTNVKIAFSL